MHLFSSGLDTKSEACQRFIKDGMTISFNKILLDDAVSTWKIEIHVKHYVWMKYLSNKWDNVFKNRQSKICESQALNNLNRYGLFKFTLLLEFFKGCLPQNLLGGFLNTRSQMMKLKIIFETSYFVFQNFATIQVKFC